MSPAGASSCVPRRIVAPACATASGSGGRPSSGSSRHTWPRWCSSAAVSSCVELVAREPERRCPIATREVGDALRVPVAHHAAELGRRTERADRLVVGAADHVEVLVRVPRREQRDREHRRVPTDPCRRAVDALVADRHEHRARDERDVGHAPVHRRSRSVRSRTMRAISAIDDRRQRGERQREAGASRGRELAERVGHAVVHEHRGQAFDAAARRRARAVPRPTSGSERTRKRRELGDRRAPASRPAPIASRASTTMNANEIGSAARSGGRSSISSPAAIAPPMHRERRPRVPAWAISVPSATTRRPAEQRTSSRAQRLTTWPPAPRESGGRVRPNRCRLPAARPPTRARRPRGRRRSARRAARSRRSGRRRTRR